MGSSRSAYWRNWSIISRQSDCDAESFQYSGDLWSATIGVWSGSSPPPFIHLSTLSPLPYRCTTIVGVTGERNDCGDRGVDPDSCRELNVVVAYDGLSTGDAVKEKSESKGLSSSDDKGSMSRNFRQYLRGLRETTCSAGRLNSGSCSTSASLHGSRFHQHEVVTVAAHMVTY